MIEVKNLTKRYDDHLAVDHLNFTMEEGRIYGFLGPNGAGKSTTMNMITGYLAPTEGSVTINGFDILEDPEEARKCIGYLPELPPLYMDMTVLEYLKFAAGLKKIPKKDTEEAISEALDFSGTADVKDRLIRNLSKGYRQRVGLAQAILGFPDIIILDEPTVGLDPIQMIEMRDTIRSLAKGHTVLLSSHILSEVSAICDHIMIISHGKMVASDTPEGLSAMMEGSNTLKFSVKDPSGKLNQVLSRLEQVEHYTVSDPDESQLVSAEIEYPKNTEIRDDLFFALCDAGLPVYSMEATSRSLEDIFIELTESEKELEENSKKTEDAGKKHFWKHHKQEEQEEED
ncbi:MAG: ABC transporter ATP-binding protein [Lachnospiraceae bacterium]|nr:ABC transporter ATP-binding protein [Lachnospiraceae bacterium]MDY4970074.1 ABC transporter ATP-binding protein [Lachnospiraceae bacterium]